MSGNWCLVVPLLLMIFEVISSSYGWSIAVSTKFLKSVFVNIESYYKVTISAGSY